MAIAQRLDLRQSQSLVMTPQLQQAIKLLQLSQLDLAQYIEAELEQNPLLEREDFDTEAPADAPLAEFPEAAETLDLATRFETAETIDPAPLDTPDAGAATADDGTDLSGLGPLDSASHRNGTGFDDEDGLAMERMAAKGPSLRDHIMAQVQLTLTEPAERLIAAHLVDLIDASGYLRGDLDAVACQLGCELALVERVLAVIQSCEPTGIGARDLAECLALQLAERNRLDPAMQTLLRHLDLLAARDLARLRALCDVDGEDLAEMISEIRALDPRPGLAFEAELGEPVVPDLVMRPLAGGGWLIELTQEALPRVIVNDRYYATVVRHAKDRGEREYLTERWQSANWLVRSLQQRANTILRVTSEIVRQQDGFFEHGVAHLRPLVLRDIADAVGMHESTISRVTSNKFMVTPRGTFELKYFFSASLASSNGGEAHSAEAVRHRIKALIDNEADDVLSDDRIVEILARSGVDIARRTVAKYRESLRIPSSVQRRRERVTRISR